MVLYGVASFQMPTVQIRPDRLGDNFYYLGFIFTLASLSAALLQLRDVPDIRLLLGNFGIALVTTVVGVAGRVLFVQMRGDIDEVEERVRRDLAAASADLRAQLVASLSEFETFHTGVIQASNEAITRATRLAEGQIAQIGEVAEKATGRLNNKVDATDARGEKLARLLERLNTTIAELPALASVELPSERLQQQIKAFSSELELLIIELRESASRVRKRGQRARWYWPFRRA
jgi:hypothetical protein